ncbi:MAG TPA: hypothetical protein VN706_11560 [Gemmatimonadaceae bacterium]|nr:hypothetical protein [Gemmatimonadaceae bacterium]
MLDPLERGAHGCGCEANAADASVALHVGEPGTPQHVHVLRDGRERHVEAGGELLDRALAQREPGQDFAPRGIGQCTERGVQGVLVMVNHMVYYRAQA